MRGPLWQLLALLSPQRRALAFALGCMGLLAATTAGFAYLTGPVLTFLLSGGRAGLGMLAHLAPDLFAHLDRASALRALPLLLMALALIKGAAYLGQFYAMGMVGQRVVAALRQKLFSHLVGLSPSYFERHPAGDLLSRFTSDVAAVELFVTYGVASLLRDGLQILVLLGVALALDWRLALGAIFLVPAAGMLVARLSRALRQRMSASQAALGTLGSRFEEGLWAHRAIQAYGLESAELARFDSVNSIYLGEQHRALRLRALMPALLEVAVVGALAATLALAANGGLGGGFAPDRLVSFVAVMALLYQPAKDLGRVGPWAVQASAGAHRVQEILRAQPAVPATRVAAPMPPMEHALQVREVHFSYGECEVLRGLDFTLRKGECLALVGESGAGKSTVLKLLLRFVDPDAGTIEIDGRELCEASFADARGQFALVTQEPLLFNDTVRANIAFARPQASQAEIEAAARATFAHEFIEKLPGGYETPLGERGVRLSGGQKQRIALARALLSGAPILLLDEATSNLDPESEREVQQALEMALRGRTALIIAHRLSGIRTANRICVLEGGRIIEEGTHDELVACHGTYARIARLQGVLDA